MNIAQEHFNKLWESEEFRKAYIEESLKFDLELQLSELKKDIKNKRSSATILKKVRKLEHTVKDDFHISLG